MAVKFAEIKVKEPERPQEPTEIPVERVNSVPRDINDVFIDGEDDRNFGNDGNNMFDEFLVEPAPAAPVEESQKAATADSYIYRMIELSGLQ